MRIDLYLKQSRLIKRRSIAHEACEKGLVLINDKVIKPGNKVNLDNLITLNLGSKKIIVKVTSLKTIKDELMYELISDEFTGQKN